MIMLRHYTHNTFPSGGWRSEPSPPPPPRLVLYKMPKVQKQLSKYLFQVYLEVLYTLWSGVTVLMPRHLHAPYCPGQRLKVIIIIKTKTTMVPVVTVVSNVAMYW